MNGIQTHDLCDTGAVLYQLAPGSWRLVCDTETLQSNRLLLIETTFTIFLETPGKLENQSKRFCKLFISDTNRLPLKNWKQKLIEKIMFCNLKSFSCFSGNFLSNYMT